MVEIVNRSWAEINLDNIERNMREIKKLVPEHTEIMGVVKADAYGHGVAEVSKTILQSGAHRLAVSMCDEGIQLRREGFDCPILILSYTSLSKTSDIINNDLIQTVYDYELAKALSDTGGRLNKKAKIHIKIDTGMTRVGFMSGYNAVKIIMEICKLPNLVVEGIYTHFASADEKDRAFTYQQFEIFMSICQELERIGIIIPVKHVANSPTIIQFPEMHLDMIRPGIILYGLYPSDEIDKKSLNLTPAMELKTNVILAKKVEKDSYISYGRTFKTNRESIIATIPIGYADGYSRLLGNKSRVLIKGQFAPVVGRICMDQCMIDVTDIEGDVGIDDEVVLFGKQNGKFIPVEEISNIIGTINYETVCTIGKRIPRAFIKNGKVSKIVNYLLD